MDSLIQMQWMVAGITGLIGVIIGLIIGVTALDYLGKCQFRKRNESKIAKLANKIISPGQNEQVPTHYTNAEIRTPILDNAGVTTDEQTTFNAPVVNISKKGIAIISQHFLKPGLTIKIRSKGDEEKIGFPFIDAEVKNIDITPQGLKIELQFLKPLKELKNS